MSIFLPPLYFGRELLDLVAHVLADAAELGVAEHVLLAGHEDHLAAGGHGALADDADRVALGPAVAVGDEQLRELLHVELGLGDHAAVGGAGEGRQQRREAGVAAEDLEHDDALVRGGRAGHLARHLDGAVHAGAEAHAVVGAGDVVVHRLGDGDDGEAAAAELDAVAERVVAAGRHQVVDAEVLEVGDDLVGEVVLLGGVLVLEVRRHVLEPAPCSGACATSAGTCRRRRRSARRAPS